MSKMRKLTDEERRLTIKNVEAMKEELEELEYASRIIGFEVSQGIDLNARAAKRQKNHQLKEIVKGINTIKLSIENSNKQLKEGVEIKEKEEVKKDE